MNTELTNEEIVDLLKAGFLPKNMGIYRLLYKKAFNKEPHPCDCNDVKVFDSIKNYFKVK